MSMIPYTTQREKIVQAYLKCELDPWKSCGCFVGNLLNKTADWADCRDKIRFGVVANEKNMSLQERMDYGMANVSIMLQSRGMYKEQQIMDLEHAFLDAIDDRTTRYKMEYWDHEEWKSHPDYEDALYHAMVVTLEKLRLIHVEMGDETAVEVPLERRVLA